MSGNSVRVVCRFRPQNKKELEMGAQVIYTVTDEEQTTVAIKVTYVDSYLFFNKNLLYNKCQ
jgi:hypothetical protein